MGKDVAVVLRGVEYERVSDTRAVIKAPSQAGEIFVADWPEGMPSPVELADAVVAYRTHLDRYYCGEEAHPESPGGVISRLARQIIEARERAGRGE